MIDVAGGSTMGNRGADRVNWNDLIRESIPDDYGTIRASDTDRARQEELNQKNNDI